MKHQPDRTTVTRKSFDQKLQTILQTDRWIIDGNYQRTLPLRFEACTDVFFLDFPLKECLEGAASRVGMVRESGFSNAADTVWIEQSYLGEEALWEKAMAISAKVQAQNGRFQAFVSQLLQKGVEGLLNAAFSFFRESIAAVQDKNKI